MILLGRLLEAVFFALLFFPEPKVTSKLQKSLLEKIVL